MEVSRLYISSLHAVQNKRRKRWLNIPLLSFASAFCFVSWIRLINCFISALAIVVNCNVATEQGGTPRFRSDRRNPHYSSVSSAKINRNAVCCLASELLYRWSDRPVANSSGRNDGHLSLTATLIDPVYQGRLRGQKKRHQGRLLCLDGCVTGSVEVLVQGNKLPTRNLSRIPQPGYSCWSEPSGRSMDKV